VGPHALRSRRAKDLPERATPGPRSTTRAQLVVAAAVQLRSWSAACRQPCPDDLRAAMPQLGVHRAPTCSQTDGRSCATGVSLAGHGIEPGPLPERLHDGDQVQPDVAAGPAPPAPAQPCGCPTRSTKAPVRTQRTRTGTRNADTDAGHPGQWTPGHPDIGHRTRGHRTSGQHTSGHRTPDAWTLTEDADRATKPRPASRHLGHHDEPTACRTPNRVPVGGSACGAQQP
jgi:hypothetical protein